VTRFEERGAEMQRMSASRFEAEKRFEYSCRLCCNRGMNIECRSCAIKSAHEIFISALNRFTTPKPTIQITLGGGCIQY